MTRKRRVPSPVAETGGEARLSRGRSRGDARFTAAPPLSAMPDSYPVTLAEIKQRVHEARLRTVLAANAGMIVAYWEIGNLILQRQLSRGWGAKVIDRLSADLREAFPGMGGLSPRNLKYMRSFASAWPDLAIVQGTLAQIGWSQNIALLDKLDDSETRLWYAQQAALYGWSQPIPCLQIEVRSRDRHGKAQNNFPLTPPPAASDFASQVFKDPYLFDFLGTADPRREIEVEQALIDHIQKFLLELGSGFAFVGRQVHLEVGDQDFYVDLLFYHLRLRCYVVVELKSRNFSPGDAGQINLYLSAVDDLLRHPDDQPAIGLLLCKGRNRLVVEYALRGMDKSIAVAAWQTQLTGTLPREFEGSLPTIEEIEAELANGTSRSVPKEKSRSGKPPK